MSLHGGSGSNTLEIVFGLTNNAGGSLTLYGPGDMAMIGSVDNSGTIGVNGSKLTVNGDATNNSGGTISTGGSGGSTITINDSRGG